MTAKVHQLRPFRYSRPSAWDREPPQRNWLIEGLALRKTVLVFNGPGAVGKSLVMQQLMTACAIGGDFLGQRMPQVASYGWFAEDPLDEIERRQFEINRYYGIYPADTDGMSVTAADEMDNPLLFEAATRQAPGRPSASWYNLRGHVIAEGCQLCVLDNAALIFGGNANYPELVAPFMQEAKKLAIEMADNTGGVVVIIQHPSQEGEASGSGQAGARAWSNLARSRWYMTFPPGDEDESSNERLIRTKKNNYGPRRGPMRVEWSQGVFVPVLASAGAPGQRLDFQQWSDLQARVVTAVRDIVARGGRASLANGSPDHIGTQLARDPEWKMFSRSEIERAAISLEKGGRLVVVDVLIQRKPRRLIRTADQTYPGEEG